MQQLTVFLLLAWGSGDEPDIDAGMEAGGNGDSNRKQASKAKVKSHMDGLTDPEANKDPEVKKALVYKRPLQPFTTRFPQEVRSGALVSPILSIPALIAVKIGMTNQSTIAVRACTHVKRFSFPRGFSGSCVKQLSHILITNSLSARNGLELHLCLLQHPRNCSSAH